MVSKGRPRLDDVPRKNVMSRMQLSAANLCVLIRSTERTCDRRASACLGSNPGRQPRRPPLHMMTGQATARFRQSSRQPRQRDTRTFGPKWRSAWGDVGNRRRPNTSLRLSALVGRTRRIAAGWRRSISRTGTAPRLTRRSKLEAATRWQAKMMTQAIDHVLVLCSRSLSSACQHPRRWRRHVRRPRPTRTAPTRSWELNCAS
mmetsp:Transcript_122393/g.341130  ORF Transcript_122393/g.341130 Transcript_122393/m.341130 type:complete len:203 (-) Transcript_122393:468-1076(-)